MKRTNSRGVTYQAGKKRRIKRANERSRIIRTGLSLLPPSSAPFYVLEGHPRQLIFRAALALFEGKSTAHLRKTVYLAIREVLLNGLNYRREAGEIVRFNPPTEDAWFVGFVPDPARDWRTRETVYRPIRLAYQDRSGLRGRIALWLPEGEHPTNRERSRIERILLAHAHACALLRLQAKCRATFPGETLCDCYGPPAVYSGPLGDRWNNGAPFGRCSSCRRPF